MYSESNFWRLTAVGIAFWPQLSGAAIFEDLSIHFQIFEHTTERQGGRWEGERGIFSEWQAFNMASVKQKSLKYFMCQLFDNGRELKSQNLKCKSLQI